jgi:hypothetical protein
MRFAQRISFKGAAVITISKAQPDGIRWIVADPALRSGRSVCNTGSRLSPLLERDSDSVVRNGGCGGLDLTQSFPVCTLATWRARIIQTATRRGLFANDRVTAYPCLGRDPVDRSPPERLRASLGYGFDVFSVRAKWRSSQSPRGPYHYRLFDSVVPAEQ